MGGQKVRDPPPSWVEIEQAAIDNDTESDPPPLNVSGIA